MTSVIYTTGPVADTANVVEGLRDCVDAMFSKLSGGTITNGGEKTLVDTLEAAQELANRPPALPNLFRITIERINSNGEVA